MAHLSIIVVSVLVTYVRWRVPTQASRGNVARQGKARQGEAIATQVMASGNPG